MQNTVSQHKQIQEFEQYARFICSHFKIDVVLDSTRAETNGKVIFLPNINGMNELELEMMYAILLHEAGHIKFSTFTPEAFAKLKTKSHAFLANAIEDARIENLLMLEFAGAKDIFETFYCEHAVNRKLMKKVFNIEGKRPDLFNCLALYVHAKLLNCKSAAFSRVATRTTYKKIRDFVIKYDINNLLKNAKMKHWEDVIFLTDFIYDLFVKEFIDPSKLLNLQKDLDIQKNTKNYLENTLEDIKKTEIFLAPYYIQYSETLKNLDDWDKSHQKEIEDLLDNQRQLQEKVTAHKAVIKFKEQQKLLTDKESLLLKKKNEFNIKKNKINDDIKAIKDKINSGINPKGKPFTVKQLQSLENQIQTKKNQLESLKKNVDRINSDMQDNAQLINNLKKTKIDNFFKDLSIEDINNILKQFNKDLSNITDKQTDLDNQRNEINTLVHELAHIIMNAISRIQTDLLNNIFEFDQQGNEQGLSLDILPPFESSPEWPQADEVQQDFDEQASKIKKDIVRNGGRAIGKFGNNLQDLEIFVSKILENVKSIDLVDLFSEKTGFSRLPQFDNNEQSMTNQIDYGYQDPIHSLTKHTILTKEFDIVKYDNQCKNRQQFLLLVKNNIDFINKTKKIFSLKFKFNKKDYYRGGKEEGLLDVRNLWKLPTKQGDDYFEINQPKLNNKIAASILIDVSGSQDKENTEYGEKLKILSIALSESMNNVHISHEILGYHAPICEEMVSQQASYTYNRRMNSLETVIYKNFQQKDNSGINNIALELSDNSDGESIRVALHRLKKERAKTKMLFIITDAKPYLSGADSAVLDDDLHNALSEAKNQKIKVLAFGFFPNGNALYGDNYCYIKDFDNVLQFMNNLKI